MTNVKIQSGSRIPNLFQPIESMEIGNPGMPGELLIYNGKLFLYGPNGETLIEAGMIQTGAILANSITAQNLTVGSQPFLHDIIWTAVDKDTCSWSSGTIHFADGTSKSIIAGNTGNIPATEIGTDTSNPDSTTRDGSIGGTSLISYESFIAANPNIASLKLLLGLDDSPAIGTVNVKIYEDNSGVPGSEISGSTKTFSIAELPVNGDLQIMTFDYTDVLLNLTVGSKYWWGVSFTRTSGSIVNAYKTAVGYTGDPYANDGDILSQMQDDDDDWVFYLKFSSIAYIYYDGTDTLKTTQDINDVLGDDYRLLAIISVVGNDGKCTITPINSIGTTINGNQIVTGKIQSVDGKTYFDLNNGRLIVNDGSNNRILLGKT